MRIDEFWARSGRVQRDSARAPSDLTRMISAIDHLPHLQRRIVRFRIVDEFGWRDIARGLHLESPEHARDLFELAMDRILLEVLGEMRGGAEA